jgi:outer membrane autotransporter protein
VGGFAAFQSAHRTFDGGVGKGDTDSVAFGGYASWLHKEGWYLDSVLKAQYFDTDYSSSAVHGAFSDYAFGLLLDFGRRFGFANGAFIEPEVQFNYAHIFTEDYTTTNGLRIRSEDNDILRFGLSVRAGWTFDLGGNGRLSPFVEAGVELQESTGGLVRAAYERWTPSTDGTRVNVGLGITWQLDDAQQIRFDYDAKFGDRYEKPWGVNLGYRYRF